MLDCWPLLRLRLGEACASKAWQLNNRQIIGTRTPDQPPPAISRTSLGVIYLVGGTSIERAGYSPSEFHHLSKQSLTPPRPPPSDSRWLMMVSPLTRADRAAMLWREGEQRARNGCLDGIRFNIVGLMLCAACVRSSLTSVKTFKLAICMLATPHRSQTERFIISEISEKAPNCSAKMQAFRLGVSSSKPAHIHVFCIQRVRSNFSA